MSFSSLFARVTVAVAVIAAAAPAPAAESADLAKLAAHISAVQTMDGLVSTPG